MNITFICMLEVLGTNCIHAAKPGARESKPSLSTATFIKTGFGHELGSVRDMLGSLVDFPQLLHPMSRQLSDFYSLIDQAIEFSLHAWRDKRVPTAVRILFLLALVYLFSPFDCLPDRAPGGYLDDITIGFIVFVFVRKVVPHVVFQDARRAAKHAACGIFFLGFTGFFHLHGAEAAALHESHVRFAQHRVYDCPKSTSLKRLASHQIQEGRSHAYPNRHIAAVTDPADSFTSRSNQKICNHVLLTCENRKMSLLLFHGGQSELYDSASMNALQSNPSEGIVLMPPLKFEWRHSRATTASQETINTGIVT